MGGRGSKAKTATGPKTSDPAAKKYDLNRKSTKRSVRKGGRKDSDSSLEDEDLNLVSVPLDASVSDKRISKARELIKSGRPISISLEATTEEPNQSKKEAWDDDSRQKWKDQLGLMRHFYDWDEIPMDFFIDTYVGGGGEALRKRRLSLNLVSEPPKNNNPASPAPLRKQVSDETLPHNQGPVRTQPPLMLVTPAPQQAPPSNATRQRAVSVDSRAMPSSSTINNKPLPIVIAEAIPEGNEAAEISPRAASAVRVPPALPERPQRAKPQEQQPARRARAASVAIGEAFPLPTAAAIQQKVTAATTTSSTTTKPSAAAKNQNKQVAQTMEFESRPRSHSNTSLDQVYGRGGGRQAANFEMENPLMRPQQQQQQQARRSVVGNEKRPEQFKNMTAVIDPTQFATERRATRVSIHRSTIPHHSSVDKPLFDDGRVSTTSTMIESNSSQSTTAGLSASRSRDMSDWL